MGILETLGLLYLILSALIGTAVLIYCVVIGAGTVRRQRERGSIEEDGSIKRNVVLRSMERSAH